MQPVPSAARHATTPSAGRRATGAECRKTCNRCQAQEDMQPMPSVGKHAICAKLIIEAQTQTNSRYTLVEIPKVFGKPLTFIQDFGWTFIVSLQKEGTLPVSDGNFFQNRWACVGFPVVGNRCPSVRKTQNICTVMQLAKSHIYLSIFLLSTGAINLHLDLPTFWVKCFSEIFS